MTSHSRGIGVAAMATLLSLPITAAIQSNGSGVCKEHPWAYGQIVVVE